MKGHPTSKGDVHIGNDVWIGRNVTIMSGVNIGDGAVIGAHSVVTKTAMPYSIVAGNPARFIKLRFSIDEISALQRIRWWEWPEDEIRKAMPLLLGEDVYKFIKQYDR